MSISGLISELRDSFLKKDFDRVEEALIIREARLRAEIEDKKREIRLLNEEIDFQRIEKMSVELELKRVKELIDGGDIACAVAERGNVGVSAASGAFILSIMFTFLILQCYFYTYLHMLNVACCLYFNSSRVCMVPF